MKFVYLLTNYCEYDDRTEYNVIGAFDSREGAEEVQKTIPNSDIEGYPINYLLDTGNMTPLFSVRMKKNGEVCHVWREEISHEDDYQSIFESYQFCWEVKNKIFASALDALVFANSENEAIEIVNKERIRLIQNGKWESI